MYGYHWEKIDVGHYWDLKGRVKKQNWTIIFGIQSSFLKR